MTTQNRKNFRFKLDAILGVLAVVSVFILIFILSHKAIFDLDIWLHLKAGEIIVKNKMIPLNDIFSFTLGAKPWVDHEWLFQVLVYLIYTSWSADGLIVAQSCVITLAFWVLFLIGYRTVKSYAEVVCLVFIAAYASVSRFNIRPDMVSLCFFAVFLYFLLFHIERKRIWLLVLIQVLWVNMHGYFFLGPLTTAFFVFAEFIRRKVKFLPWHWKGQLALSDTVYRRLKQVLLLVILACFLNPNGLKGAGYPFFVMKEIFSGKTNIFFEYIKELQPTLTFGRRVVNFDYYKIITISSLALMVINFKKIRIIDILLISFYFLFALRIRNIVFFSFIGYVIIVFYIGQTVQKIAAMVEVRQPFKQSLAFLYRSISAIALIAIFWVEINSGLDANYYDFEAKETKSLLLGTEERSYPKKAVDFILSNSISPRMFNDFNSGAYLIGRAYPQRKVFIDGRTEIYGQEFFQAYVDFLNRDSTFFDCLVTKYNLEAAMVSMAHSDPPLVVKHMYEHPQWELVFLDKNAVIFLKNIPAHQELIKKYKIDLNIYVPPQVILKELGIRQVYPQEYMKRAVLFNILEKDDLVIQECRLALKIMPACAEAYHLMGKAYLRKKMYQEAHDSLRAALLFIPGSAEVLIDLGASLKELREYPYALRILKRAIRISPGQAPAYYLLANVYLLSNSEAEAINALYSAIKYAPKVARSHFKLGELLFEKAKRHKDKSVMRKAKEALTQALNLCGSGDRELRSEVENKLKEVSHCN